MAQDRQRRDGRRDGRALVDADNVPDVPRPQGQVVTSHRFLGRLSLTVSTEGITRTLLSVAAPPEYTLSPPEWSPTGEWFTVVDSASRILLVTVEQEPHVRFLVDGGGPAVTTATFTRLGSAS